MSKVALITGGSSGLGFCFARILGSQGYHIIISARNKQKIDKAVNELRQKNSVSASGIVFDITDENEVRAAAEQVKNEFGKIDFLILNAGEVTIKLLSEYTNTSELKKDLEIDLWGTIQTTWYFQPLLAEKSKILMISSGFGLMGAAGYSIYCAAKGGIINFAESLRRELLCKNINVYVACTGDLDTPQFRYEMEHQPAWMKKTTPRSVMQPMKIAAGIIKKCKGSTKFLIIYGSDVKLLTTASRFIPRTWREKLIDVIMPRPK
jgi:short-subunit dehydrogenase